MAVTLTLTGKTPSNPNQYQLDSFQEHYKCDATADVVLTDGSVPAMGAAHPDYATMFVTARYVTETAESASILDLTYTGTFNGSFPTQKETSGGQVASATTNTSSAIFPLVATNPATVQFFAGTTTVDFYSDDPADTSEPPDPPTIDHLITWDLGFGVQPGGSTSAVEAFLLGDAFIQGVMEAPPSIEPIVDGEIWHIVKTKTRTLFPYTA